MRAACNREAPPGYLRRGLVLSWNTLLLGTPLLLGTAPPWNTFLGTAPVLGTPARTCKIDPACTAHACRHGNHRESADSLPHTKNARGARERCSLRAVAQRPALLDHTQTVGGSSPPSPTGRGAHRPPPGRRATARLPGPGPPGGPPGSPGRRAPPAPPTPPRPPPP